MMQIQAGTFKGHKLLSPPGHAATRPLTGLAKKSLFDTLSAWLDAGRVVDLYAGTGTIGLEAISRGADYCWLAERDRHVVNRLRRNIAALGAQDRCEVWAGDVEKRLAGWLASLEAPVDVVFLDPPFAASQRWDLAEMTTSLFEPIAGSLAPDGIVVLRMGPKVEIPDRVGPLEVVRRRQSGSMSLFFLQLPGAP
jgi:16S rRNA (guanine(966)-N(2))-methyltransferase RsmD